MNVKLRKKERNDSEPVYVWRAKSVLLRDEAKP